MTETEIGSIVNRFCASPRPMLIGDQWLEATDGGIIDVVDPATGQAFASVHAAGAVEVDRAVRAAVAAGTAGPWRRATPVDRTRMLWRLADLIEQHGAELALLTVREQGKPLGLAEGLDVAGSAETLRYYAGWCTKLEGTTISASLPDERPPGALGPAYHAYSLREPVGVVAAIVPWNVPLLMAVAKLGPALAAGCTVVLKPAEETPLTALRLGELILEAGFPPGVVNVIPGLGHITGAALVDHPAVDKIAFTGSTEVGKRIVAASSHDLKRVTLELGGKSPLVVFADADLEAAADAAALSIFVNSGQMCFACSRLFVEAPVHDEFLDLVAARAAAMPIGPGDRDATEIGPLISAAQRDRVMEYIRSGTSDGAELVAGGRAVDGDGFFVEPTIFRNSNTAARIFREEIFGPVLVSSPFIDLGDALRLANDTTYGLAASVFTKDLSTAHTMAGAMDAGMVWVNCMLALDENLPFGGFKQSGLGYEGSHQGVAEYLRSKSVVVQL